MADARSPTLHFDVSTGLKSVLGSDLITNDEVALFELVKNSFDAEATKVDLHFSQDSIVVSDNGTGMSYEDIRDKWLFVAYSSKRSPRRESDFREEIADRRNYGWQQRYRSFLIRSPWADNNCPISPNFSAKWPCAPDCSRLESIR